MTSEQRGSWVAAGLVGLAVGGGFLGIWYLAVEQPSANCGQGESWCGFGGAVLMFFVGIPVAYLVWSLGMRAAGVANSWGAPILIMVALYFLVGATDVLAPPQLLWVVVAGVLSAGWARIPRLGFAPR